MRNSFGIGDVVTYGKSNTEWEITEETAPAEYTLRSEKGSTKRNVSWDKLTLVRNAEPVCADVTEEQAFSDFLTDDEIETEIAEGGPELGLTDAQVEELDETYADHGMSAAQDLKTEYKAAWNDPFTVPDQPYAKWEIRSLHPWHNYVLHVDGSSKTYKTFNAAADALVIAGRTGFYAAAIDHDGRRLVTR